MSPVRSIKKAVQYLTGHEPKWEDMGGWDVRDRRPDETMPDGVAMAVGELLSLLDDLQPGGDPMTPTKPEASAPVVTRDELAKLIYDAYAAKYLMVSAPEWEEFTDEQKAPVRAQADAVLAYAHEAEARGAERERKVMLAAVDDHLRGVFTYWKQPLHSLRGWLEMRIEAGEHIAKEAGRE